MFHPINFMVDSIQYLFLCEHMFQQTLSIYVGIYVMLFVATDMDHSDYVHIVLRALQR